MKVALLAEGVDRNSLSAVRASICFCVALLAEGVDRNLFIGLSFPYFFRSPSSRRAWIEIYFRRKY